MNFNSSSVVSCQSTSNNQINGGNKEDFVFGDFESEEYFSEKGVPHTGVEFLCDTYNAIKTWVEGGSKPDFTYLDPSDTDHEFRQPPKTDMNLSVKNDLTHQETIDSGSASENHFDEIQNTQSNGTVCDSKIAINDVAENKFEDDKEETITKQEQSAVKPSSWASLFKASDTTNFKDNKVSDNAPIILSVQMEIKNDNKTLPAVNDLSLIAMDLDERAHKLADTISQISPNYTRHHLQLRGLVNHGNWCYINTTLQALLGISPISHFYKSLKGFLQKNTKSTSTPLTDSLISFFDEFEPINPKIPLKKQSEDLRAGASFEPRCVYDVLPALKTSLSEKGRQEDAEEFLSFLLNGIHEELVALHKIAQPPTNEMNGDGLHDSKEYLSDDDAWEQVGPKNKSSTMRKAVIEESLIKHMFGGVIRSSVHRSGMKESTTLQPFFTIQLDIQSDKIWTLFDAIECYFMKETLQGFNCSKTNTEVEASRRLSIEELPLMLIFHLKYFVYDLKGGCQKIYKAIDIPVDLEIPRDVISVNSKLKMPVEYRRYKLYAVIYHHGKDAAGGHYTAAVHHGNPFGWVLFDDNIIKTVNVNQVLKHQQTSVPYLLFYERVQTR